MTGLVMPWMLFRRTSRWYFEPPLPRRMPPLFHVRRVGAGRSPSLIVRRGTPRAPRRARSSAEAFLQCLDAVSYLLVAFTRVLLRPNERITNARARASKRRVFQADAALEHTLVSKHGASSSGTPLRTALASRSS